MKTSVKYAANEFLRLKFNPHSLPCPPQWLLIYYIWRQRTNLIIQHFKNGFSFLLHEISYLLPANPLIILWVVLFSLSMPAVFTLKITKSGQLESNRSQFKSRVVTRSSCMKFSIFVSPLSRLSNHEWTVCSVLGSRLVLNSTKIKDL